MLDVERNRKARKYSGQELFGRALWTLVQPCFRFSPRPCFSWRSVMLRAFGAKIGRHVHIYPSVVIYLPWNLEVHDFGAIGDGAFIYNLAPVTVGSRATISHRAHLCGGTHDFTKRDFPLLRLPIRIGEQAWIGADAFIGPGVTVNEGAVVGARAVVVKDVAPWMVVVGNPAREVKRREIVTK